MAKIACVAVVKNEAPHIAEWIAYQFVIGFDTVIILDNLSTDETRSVALKLAEALDVRVLSSPDTSEHYQKSAYLGALERFGSEFDWMAFFDADEFLVPDHFQTLQDILADHETTAAIGVNWAIFGSSGHREQPHGRTLENYRWRSDASFGPNKHVKSIVRPDRVKGFINGHSFDVDGPYRFLSGQDITWISAGIVEQAPDYRRGKLHHYFVRSWQDWQAKIQRGYPDLTRDVGEFDAYDRNEIRDQSAWDLITNAKTANQRGDITINGVAVGRNIALNKPATQSSISEWSLARTKEADAAGAVNGKLDGQRKFHTAFEPQPWWQVDLDDNMTITAIRIFNTIDDTAFRFQKFSLAISFDGHDWIEFFRKEDDGAVGGIASAPFVWMGELPVWGRFVRVTLLGEGFLHLDQVEIYSHESAVWTIPMPALNLFAFEKNPLGQEGFVIGWEAAKLGNRLSTFANLFALSERTGVTTGYQQIMNAHNLIDVAENPYLFLSGKYHHAKAKLYGDFCQKINGVFENGFSAYMARERTVTLSALPELNREIGIVAYVKYEPEFHNLSDHENNIRDFCNRGNALILAGGFWYQYLDMRMMAAHGDRLKQKLRIAHQDHAPGRAAIMAGDDSLAIRIGVHIRKTDYKYWHNGIFDFSIADYIKFVDKVHGRLSGYRHRFYIFSDEPIDIGPFAHLPVCYEAGSAEDDFVALSKCHYVVGPPSTFSTWAAFFGGGRRLVLTPERLAGLTDWHAPLADSVKIDFPTGGYLPGDVMGRPI